MKAENTGSMSAPAQQQAEGPGDQLNGMVGHSPFARPGSRAGASTAPTTLMEVPSASISPFAWPGSRTGSAQPRRLQGSQMLQTHQFHLLVAVCFKKT